MILRFAFAVNKANRFIEQNFGDADKYLIYTLESGKMQMSSVEINEYKLIDKENEHWITRKGSAIIKFLKEKEVNVLVSTQFGQNIKLINKHFIPVIISIESQDELINLLNKHKHWIMDEWKNNKTGFKLFTIKSGILKSSIEE